MRFHVGRSGRVGVSFGWPGLLAYGLLWLCAVSLMVALAMLAVLVAALVVIVWALGILVISSFEREPAAYGARIGPRFQHMADTIAELTRRKRTGTDRLRQPALSNRR